ncbi:MAG: hypothetical protein OXN27_15035, partial [Candidatus Poribacteria bacterium]|nr:hypothetical protein [Candidatus Poribacteria bacterium]
GTGSDTVNPTHHTDRHQLPEKVKGLPKNRHPRNDLDTREYQLVTGTKYQFNVSGHTDPRIKNRSIGGFI